MPVRISARSDSVLVLLMALAVVVALCQCEPKHWLPVPVAWSEAARQQRSLHPLADSDPLPRQAKVANPVRRRPGARGPLVLRLTLAPSLTTPMHILVSTGHRVPLIARGGITAANKQRTSGQRDRACQTPAASAKHGRWQYSPALSVRTHRFTCQRWHESLGSDEREHHSCCAGVRGRSRASPGIQKELCYRPIPTPAGRSAAPTPCESVGDGVGRARV
jgi:hypothetical protein